MTASETVISILTTEGRYRLLSTPLKIGSQEFNFTGILAATERANDLVVVVELTGAVPNEAVVRSVLAFTRALDVIGSRRPVTVVLTTGQADKDLVNAINRVCRVLPIGAPSGEGARQVIKDWLAALLPLENPPPVGHLAEWRGALEGELKNELPEGESDRFIALALNGKEAVEEALADLVTTRANQALEDKP